MAMSKLPTVLIESPAFQALRTKAARQVFVVLLEKQEDTALNDRQIVFTYQEASECGISAGRFVKAIDQLVQMGLVDVVGMKREKSNRFPVTLYTLSKRWKYYGEKRFKHRERAKRKLASC